MKEPIVTVVGSFAVGMTLRTDRMPVFGETLMASDFNLGPGGKGSNQAVAAARLGAKAHFVGLIGDDPLGKIALDLYATEGVDASHLVVSKEFPPESALSSSTRKARTASCLTWGLTSGSTEPLSNGPNR